MLGTFIKIPKSLQWFTRPFLIPVASSKSVSIEESCYLTEVCVDLRATILFFTSLEESSYLSEVPVELRVIRLMPTVITDLVIA